VGGYVYHVRNRGNARLPLFQKDGDYEAFEPVLCIKKAASFFPSPGDL